MYLNFLSPFALFFSSISVSLSFLFFNSVFLVEILLSFSFGLSVYCDCKGRLYQSCLLHLDQCMVCTDPFSIFLTARCLLACPYFLFFSFFHFCSPFPLHLLYSTASSTDFPIFSPLFIMPFSVFSSIWGLALWIVEGLHSNCDDWLIPASW